MQSHSKPPNPAEPAIKRALGHPKRLEIFGYLTQKGAADEAELVEALDLAAPRVRYHLSVLQSAELIAHVAGGEAGHSYIAAASAGL
jgi:DNA-binding transcriptional ArsR family regulator